MNGFEASAGGIVQGLFRGLPPSFRSAIELEKAENGGNK
jgi:hypothetical protein